MFGVRGCLVSVSLVCALVTALPVRAEDPPIQAAAAMDAGTSPEAAALAALGLTGGQVQALALPADVGAGLLVDVSLDGVPRTLLLKSHSVRAPGFQLIEVGSDGVWRPRVPSRPTTVRGEVLGVPGSVVAGALRNGELFAQVTLFEGHAGWTIEPLPGSALHVVYGSADVLVSLDHACATHTDPAPDSSTAPSLLGTSTFPMLSANLAVDADVESFEQLGSVAAVEDDIETVINGVSALYESFSGLRIDISILVVRTAEPDPYTQVDPSLLLDEVRAAWLDPPPGVDVDFVQLFRGLNLPGGVAGVADGGGIVCGEYLFSSVVEMFTFPGLKKRVALSAHELGHLFGAFHCQSAPGCAIMCPILGACGPLDEFGPDSVQSIQLAKFSATCLDFVDTPLPPLVTEVTPLETQSFNPTFFNVSGQGFTMTSAVEIDGEPMDPFFFKVLADDQLSFRPPVPDQLGTLAVRIIAPGGETDRFEIAVTGNDPPVLAVNSLVLGGQPMSWQWGGPEGHAALLLLSLDPETVAPHGFEQLASFVRWVVQPLDDQALGGLAIPEVPAAAGGLVFHSQVLTFDGHMPSGASPIMTTTVFSFP